ncbi:MAG: hypothetical protein QNK11_03135 [Legionella sp.]|nr:hypothetical protein [Legionella sp.]
MAQDVFSIQFEYRAYSASLIASQNNKEIFNDLLLATIELNIYLYDIYEQIGEKNKQRVLLAEYALLRPYIKSMAPADKPRGVGVLTYSQEQDLTRQILSNTEKFDFWRRVSGRIQRVLLFAWAFLEPLINAGKAITKSIASCGGLLRFINLIFFLPRLLVHFFLLFKYLLSTHQPQIRTYLEIDSRGFTLLNDLVLLSVAIFAFFCFVGAWAPFAVYLTIALQVAEFLISTAVMCFEGSRLNGLMIYQTELTHSLSKDAKNIVLEQLNAFILYQKSIRVFPVITRALLVVCSLAFLPSCAALSLVIPLMGAIFSLILVSVRAPCLQGYFLPDKPKSDLFRFFHEAPEKKEFSNEHEHQSSAAFATT